MRLSRFLLILFASLLLQHCALPTPPRATQFVGDRELAAVKFSRLGLAQMARGQLIDAELNLRQALYLYPNLSNLKQNLALVLSKQGEVEQAQEIFDDLLRSTTDPLALRLAQGDMFYFHGDFESAAKYYLAAYGLAEKAQKSQELARINRSLAVLYFKIGKEEQALCYSQQAFALRPGNMDEAYRHIRMLIALNQFSQAAQSISKIASSSATTQPAAPALLTEPRLLYLQGLSEFARKNFALALKDANSSLDLGASDFGIEAEATWLGNLARRELTEVSEKGSADSQLAGLQQLGPGSTLYLPPSLLEAAAAQAELSPS